MCGVGGPHSRDPSLKAGSRRTTPDEQRPRSTMGPGAKSKHIARRLSAFGITNYWKYMIPVLFWGERPFKGFEPEMQYKRL